MKNENSFSFVLVVYSYIRVIDHRSNPLSMKIHHQTLLSSECMLHRPSHVTHGEKRVTTFHSSIYQQLGKVRKKKWNKSWFYLFPSLGYRPPPVCNPPKSSCKNMSHSETLWIRVTGTTDRHRSHLGRIIVVLASRPPRAVRQSTWGDACMCRWNDFLDFMKCHRHRVAKFHVIRSAGQRQIWKVVDPPARGTSSTWTTERSNDSQETLALYACIHRFTVDVFYTKVVQK